MASDPTSQAPPKGPLNGLRILDLGRIVAAPTCTQILADFGAEVIKIERPGRGDEMRHYGPAFVLGEDGKPTLDSGQYLAVNRNKRSVTVDISTPEGRDIILQLAKSSDVLVENFKVGDLARYGLDYENVRKVNEGIVYCSITGFGQTGPYAPRPGYDAVFQALSGLMSVTGEPDREPQKIGVVIVDILTGIYAAAAILTAIHHRRNGGTGQYIDLALLDVGVAAMATRSIEYVLTGRVPTRLGTQSAGSTPAQLFRCSDGYINVQAGSDGAFAAVCHALGVSRLIDDPRFAIRRDRFDNREQLIPILSERFLTNSADYWYQELLSRGVVVSPVLDVAQMFENEQVLARGMHVPVDHPRAGRIKLVANPVRFSETPVSEYRTPPSLGENTDEVLREMLALNEAELVELRLKKII